MPRDTHQKSARSIGYLRLLAVVFAMQCVCAMGATAQGVRLAMDKVDPPNWWAGMPKPMLLVRGEGLGAATFSVSDACVDGLRRWFLQRMGIGRSCGCRLRLLSQRR